MLGYSKVCEKLVVICSFVRGICLVGFRGSVSSEIPQSKYGVHSFSAFAGGLEPS